MTGILWLDLFVTVTIVGGALGLLARAVTGLARRLRRLSHFLDDWNGEEARPGVPFRPGFAERVALIEAELKPNHGSSLRDAINRVEQGVRRVEDGLASHLQQHREALLPVERLRGGAGAGETAEGTPPPE
ncbi:hypothetical protein [Nonomuraea endophytica]|uniref:Uncharacterized protein n=1 Tax=Nonomuraea endophytica TaxID=714136 RepID=A0A7W8A897_9ACTN|nr:hypothetical protein [Nonomuraea endophytica]MBB5081389.1 hypothetical protein [Nonomuraea endophytica]